MNSNHVYSSGRISWPKPSRAQVMAAMFQPGNILAVVDSDGITHRVVAYDLSAQQVKITPMYLGFSSALVAPATISFDDIKDDWLLIQSKTTTVGDLMT